MQVAKLASVWLPGTWDLNTQRQSGQDSSTNTLTVAAAVTFLDRVGKAQETLQTAPALPPPETPKQVSPCCPPRSLSTAPPTLQAPSKPTLLLRITHPHYRNTKSKRSELPPPPAWAVLPADQRFVAQITLGTGAVKSAADENAARGASSLYPRLRGSTNS